MSTKETNSCYLIFVLVSSFAENEVKHEPWLGFQRNICVNDDNNESCILLGTSVWSVLGLKVRRKKSPGWWSDTVFATHLLFRVLSLLTIQTVCTCCFFPGTLKKNLRTIKQIYCFWTLNKYNHYESGYDVKDALKELRCYFPHDDSVWYAGPLNLCLTDNLCTARAWILIYCSLTAAHWCWFPGFSLGASAVRDWWPVQAASRPSGCWDRHQPTQMGSLELIISNKGLWSDVFVSPVWSSSQLPSPGLCSKRSRNGRCLPGSRSSSRPCLRWRL